MQRKFIIKSKQIRANAAQAVSLIRGDENLEVVIQPHVDSKTREQENFWHMLLDIMAKETGYTQPEMKELVKKAILGTKTVTLGRYEHEVTQSSAYDENGKPRSKPSYSELIEQTYMLAAEAGIVLPSARYTGEVA